MLNFQQIFSGDVPHLVLSDFGCALATGTWRVRYETDTVDLGGNLSLRAPEVNIFKPFFCQSSDLFGCNGLANGRNQKKLKLFRYAVLSQQSIIGLIFGWPIYGLLPLLAMRYLQGKGGFNSVRNTVSLPYSGFRLHGGVMVNFKMLRVPVVRVFHCENELILVCLSC